MPGGQMAHKSIAKLLTTCPKGTMNRQRTHILLPQALLRDIDRMVGPRGRSAFLVETAQEEVKSRKLLQFLENDEPAWKDGDQPRDERRFGCLGTRAEQRKTTATRQGTPPTR